MITIQIGTRVVFVANDGWHRRGTVIALDRDDAVIEITDRWACASINNQRSGEGAWIATRPTVTRQFTTCLAFAK